MRLPACGRPPSGFAPACYAPQVSRRGNPWCGMLGFSRLPMWSAGTVQASPDSVTQMHMADSDRFQSARPVADAASGDRRSDPKVDIDLIFRCSPVGLLLVRDQRLVRANAAMEVLFGCEPGELAGRRQSFAHPADRLLVASLLEHCSDLKGSQGDFEFYLYRRRGEPVWVSARASPVDPESLDAGWVFALMDIDVRRRAAEADARSRSLEELGQTRRYLDGLLEFLPVAVALRDCTSGRFRSINPAGERLFGLTRNQILGRTWHEIYGKRFADFFAEMDRLALARGGVIERSRVPMLRADGDVRRVDYKVMVIGGEGAEDAGVVVSIAEDRTEQVRLHDTMLDSELRLRHFADSIDQFIFVAQSDLKRLIFTNGRLEALVGIDSGTVLEDVHRLRDVIAESDLADFDLRWRRRWAALRRMRKVEFTVRVHHARRGLRWLNVRLQPARVGQGETRIFGVADDVTERWVAQTRQTEDALAQRDNLLRELHDRISHHLEGVAAMLRQMGAARPELASLLDEIAGQVVAVGSVHGVQHASAERAPVLDLVQGVCVRASERTGVDVHFESDDPQLWNWGLAEGESVALALVVHELCDIALQHRARTDDEVSVVACGQARGLVVEIRYAGSLPSDGTEADGSNALHGLGLVRSLLPGRGSRLRVEADANGVRMRLFLREPALSDLRDDFA